MEIKSGLEAITQGTTIINSDEKVQVTEESFREDIDSLAKYITADTPIAIEQFTTKRNTVGISLKNTKRSMFFAREGFKPTGEIFVRQGKQYTVKLVADKEDTHEYRVRTSQEVQDSEEIHVVQGEFGYDTYDLLINKRKTPVINGGGTSKIFVGQAALDAFPEEFSHIPFYEQAKQFRIPGFYMNSSGITERKKDTEVSISADATNKSILNTAFANVLYQAQHELEVRLGEQFFPEFREILSDKWVEGLPLELAAVQEGDWIYRASGHNQPVLGYAKYKNGVIYMNTADPSLQPVLDLATSLEYIHRFFPKKD